MNKDDFIETLKAFRGSLVELKKTCLEVSGNQLQSKKIFSAIEAIARVWFDTIESNLDVFSVNKEILLAFHDRFEKLLELIGGRPTKGVVITILDSLIDSFHTNILVPVQKSQLTLKFPILDDILNHAKGIEMEYLNEAVECARLDKKRAAIILGWCAAVNRLHLFIAKEGFDKFNKASRELTDIKTGRYKRFNSPYDIHNLTELRSLVPDGNLLWVLEYLEAIDGMQHERLEICLTMRDTCAHPGETIITDENLPSFFSDLKTLIFDNEKFALIA